MEYLVKIDNLEKRYDDFSLRALNLAVEPGAVVGFVGANGAGKTTTLKALLGIIEPDGGTVELFGERVTANSSALDGLKARIGVVLDTCAFPGTCTVKAVGTIGRSAYSSWNADVYQELCQRFELAPKKKVSELSRGMGMKLTLAFALAHDPELLVLDEATAGLDPMAREEVLDLLRAFMEDGRHGILMSTHITSDLEKIADEVVCIDEGALVFDLPKDAIVDTAGVARCRASELETVLKSDYFGTGEAFFAQHGYHADLLVPDRFAFARAFPHIAVEHATIEDYMALRLRGEHR